MTIDEAIAKYRKSAEECRQIAAWLEELKRLRKEKPVTVAKIITKDAITTYIEEDKYLGTNHFILREDLCKADYKKRIKKLFFREVATDIFKSVKMEDYSLKEKEAFDYKEKIICLKDEEFEIYLDKNYYKYFKQQGLEFKFSSNHSYIGLFKNDEWVGAVMPIKISQK